MKIVSKRIATKDKQQKTLNAGNIQNLFSLKKHSVTKSGQHLIKYKLNKLTKNTRQIQI